MKKFMNIIVSIFVAALLNFSCEKDGEKEQLVAPRISVSNPVPALGEEVQFYYRASVSATPLWKFEDGTTSVGAVAKHVFTQEKKHKVTLELTNDQGKKVTSVIEVEVMGRRLTDEFLRLVNTPEEIWVTAHRANTHFGVQNGIPENSLAAIDKAIAVGANILEIDVRESSDGHFVLMHDASLSRTTNSSGNVRDRTLEQLRSYKLRDAKGVITEHSIPTLEEALLAGRGKVFFCLDKTTDIKSKKKLLDLISSLHMLDRVFFYLSSKDAASQLKEANSRSMIFPWASEISSINSWLSDHPSIHLVHVDYTVSGVADVIAYARTKNIITYANTMNNAGDNNMLNGNFSFIQAIKSAKLQIVSTDYPELLKNNL